MLFYRNGLFVVGPDSASAHPGPACYRKGGPLTVTDANLLLGRLLPEHFPKIFGPNEDEALDVEITRKKFEELAAEINAEQQGKTMTIDEIAEGFLNVANEAMSRPSKSVLWSVHSTDTSSSCIDGSARFRLCKSPLGIVRWSWRTTRLRNRLDPKHTTRDHPQILLVIVSIRYGSRRRSH